MLAAAQGSSDLNEVLGAVIGTTPQPCASLSWIKRDPCDPRRPAEAFASAVGVGRRHARTACRLTSARAFFVRRRFLILPHKGNWNGLSRAFGIRDQDGRRRRI